MKPRNRKFKLGQLGAVVISFFGVLAVLFPDRAEYLVKLGAALGAFLGLVVTMIGYEDGKHADASQRDKTP